MTGKCWSCGKRRRTKIKWYGKRLKHRYCRECIRKRIPFKRVIKIKPLVKKPKKKLRLKIKIQVDDRVFETIVSSWEEFDRVLSSFLRGRLPLHELPEDLRRWLKE